MTVIVQLSDTHLCAGGAPAYGTVDTLDALRRTAEHLRHLHATAGGIDALVITGDLTESGETAAYTLVREALAPLPFPLHVLPGNHDRREAMRTAFPGFAASGPLDRALAVGPLRLVLVDAMVEGQPYGAVTETQLHWLEETLAGFAPHPTLVFMHFPPFATGIAFMDANGLREPERMEAVIRRHPHVQLVACGHIHRAITAQWGGVPCVVAPGPSHSVAFDVRPDAVPSYALEPGGVLVHRWDGTRVVSQISHIDAWGGARPFGT